MLERYSIVKLLQVIAALMAIPTAISLGMSFAMGDPSRGAPDTLTIEMIVGTIGILALTGLIGRRLILLVPPLLLAIAIASGYLLWLWILIAWFVSGNEYAVTAYLHCVLLALIAIGCCVTLYVFRRQFLDET